MHWPGDFSHVYLLALVSLGFSWVASAAAVFGEKRMTETSNSSPPAPLPSAPLSLSTFPGRIENRTMTTNGMGAFNTRFESPGATIPLSAFRTVRDKKNRQNIEMTTGESEGSRARRNIIEKSRRKAVQNEDDILRLLSMISAKDGINFYPGNRGKEETQGMGGFTTSIFRHGNKNNFDFSENPGILENLDNYEDEDDDDDAIELGSFGAKAPPIVHRDSPVSKVYTAGHREWDPTSSRKSGRTLNVDTGDIRTFEKEWLDPIQLYSHQIRRRNSLIMKRKRDLEGHPLFSSTQPSVPILNFILSGPQQMTDPNIPVYHRLIL